ncbi:MMPL family transporter [Opitutales bacterium ASA1]|uniref:hypothetical protein n=1 Tax=Congregicoccus parvus TaxID=3081749 RepID=UPI002B3085F3|nr:MMPL family transporter [Opitutales bacterium ASA1]
MVAARHRLLARIVLVVCSLVFGWRLATLDFAERISTDVLDLVPEDAHDPEIALVRSLASDRAAGIVLLAIDAPSTSTDLAPAREAVLEVLRGHDVFAEVVDLGADDLREQLGTFVFEHRIRLQLPGRLLHHDASALDAPLDVEAFARDAVAELDRFLQTPEATAFEALIPADPLLLVPKLVDRLPGGAAGAWTGARDDRALIWTQLRGSPLDDAVQRSLFAVVDEAAARLAVVAPDAQLRWTSVARFAAASRTRIQAELAALNTASIVAVLLVTVVLLRRIRDLLHLLPIVIFAMAGAWVTTLLVFDRLPVLVLVVGSLLAGVAIDYGFHLLGRSEAREPLRALLRPLLASAATTLVGFSILFLSGLPVIRAIGVFVASGLFWALAGALLWYLAAGAPFLQTRDLARRALPHGRARHIARTALALAALAAVSGLWRLSWHDDIRELEIPSPELRQEDRDVRARFGEVSGTHAWMALGGDPGAALDDLEAFAVFAAREGARVTSAGFLMPSRMAWEVFRERHAALPTLGDAIRRTLVEADYEVEAFEPFFTALDAVAREPLPAYDDLVRDAAARLPGPVASALHFGAATNWVLATADRAFDPADMPPYFHVVPVDQLATLNDVFARYREATAFISVWGGAAAVVVVLLVVGLRRGARVVLLPLLSCAVTLGVFGLAGVTLNLFHVLALMLGACLGLDYAIFAADHARRGLPPPPSIRLSALTTSASFGVLAFSAIPVVAALGATVTISVLTTLAVLELLAPIATAARQEARP